MVKSFSLENLEKQVLEISFNRKTQKLVILLFFVLATSYFFLSIFFGLDFSDGFYHINQALYTYGDWSQHKFFLSSIIINYWIEVFGKNLIGLRFFNALIIYFSALIPILFLNTRNRWEQVFTLGIALVLIAPLNANILGYDTFTIIICSIVFTILISFLKSKNYLKLGCLAFFCAAAVFIRFPNIILLGIIPLSLFIDKSIAGTNYKLFVKRSLIFLVLSFLFLVSGYLLFFSNDQHFGENFFTHKQSHQIGALLKNYISDAPAILLYSSIITLSFFLLKKIWRERFYWTLLLVIFLSILLVIFIIDTKYARSYSLMMTSIALVFSAILYLDSKPGSFHRVILASFVLMLFVSPFGSDTGLLKSSFLFVLFPAVLSASFLEMRKLIMATLLLILPFAFLEKVNAIYEDGKMHQLIAKPKNKLLSPVRTTELRKTYLDKIDEEVKKLTSEDVSIYFYGKKSHLFTFLYPQAYSEAADFRQPLDDPKSIAEIRNKLIHTNKAAIFIVNSYPNADDTSDESNKLVEELKENNFQKIKIGNLEYYLKR